MTRSLARSALAALAALALACGGGGGGGSTDPTTPTDPSTPTDPTTPTDPVTPTDPTDPVTPPAPCLLTTPGAAWLAFASNRTGSYAIHLVRADGSCVQKVTDDAGADLFPAWTPAGLLAYEGIRTSGSGLFTRDLAAGTLRGLPIVFLAGSAVPSGPAWSPDGTTIAFDAKLAGATRSDVYVAGAGGGLATALTAAPGSSAGPVWAPDGSKIYFVSSQAADRLNRIYSMSPSGADVALVAASGGGVLGRPAVSPDGRSLAFCRAGTGGAPEVVLHDLTTGAEQVVSSHGDSEPAFDRTGTHLVVTSTRGGDSALWRIDLPGGGNPLRLTTPGGGAVDGQAAFRPE